jgi:Mg-chelatase subunit ChlD
VESGRWAREIRDEVESFGLSLVLHLLLLLLLGAVTLGGGGGGRGDRPGEGGLAGIAPGAARGILRAEALEQLLAKEEIRPIEPELAAPRPVGERASQWLPPARRAPERLGSGRGIGAGVGGGFGGGIGRGIGTGFGDFLGQLRHAGFDAVFVIDATGSMDPVIEPVKARIDELIAEIQRLVPVARVGIVLYKDEGPLSDFVVRKSDLTFHGDKLRSILAGVQAEGGGPDWEEAVARGLATAVREMSWRQRSRKVIVLVANSPPHPQDWPEIEQILAEFRGRGGVVTAIEAALPEFRDEVRRSLERIAAAGGGEVLSLDERESILRSLMVAAFGAEWKTQLAEAAKRLDARREPPGRPLSP